MKQVGVYTLLANVRRRSQGLSPICALQFLNG
jgi:hypothetical protein